MGFGLIVVAIGVIWLLDNLYIINFDWDWFWPLLLIAAGVFLLVRSNKHKEHYIFSSQHRKITGDIDGLSLSQTMGSIKIDLTEGRLNSGINRVKTSVVMGETRVIVPTNEAVRVEASVLLGDAVIMGSKRDGVNFRHEFQTPGYEQATRKILIEADVTLGDIKIKTP